jgi:hypothetical protein
LQLPKHLKRQSEIIPIAKGIRKVNNHKIERDDDEFIINVDNIKKRLAELKDRNSDEYRILEALLLYATHPEMR